VPPPGLEYEVSGARDQDLLAHLDADLAALLEGSVVPYLQEVRDLLAEGWEVSDDGRKRLLALLKLAIDFNTWRSLERKSGLGRDEAVETMLEAVRSAVSPRGAP
jgi:hypothetical protein